MYIGDQIKALRKQKDITLVDLSKSSGIQIATLSRIENKKMIGTLESHLAIAKALGTDITFLYSNIKIHNTEAEAKEKKLIETFVLNDKASMEILASKLFTKRMMPCLLRIEANGQTSKEQNISGTEKFIYIIEGKIELVVGKEIYSLNKNNSLYFNAALEHFYINKSAKIAKALIICTPVAL